MGYVNLNEQYKVKQYSRLIKCFLIWLFVFLFLGLLTYIAFEVYDEYYEEHHERNNDDGHYKWD